MAHPAHPTRPTVEELQRDLTSAHARNRTLLRELTRAASAPVVVSVMPGPHKEFDRIVVLSNGVELHHKWTAADGWRYVQAECIPGTLAAIVDGVFAARRDVELAGGGMAVVV